MADKTEKESKHNGHLTADSIKVIAESIGISGIPDSAATYLGEDSTYRLKQVVEVNNDFINILFNVFL